MNTRRSWTIAAIALLALLGAGFGRPWIALAYHAQSYPVTGASEIANVVIDGKTAFASYASRGFAVIDARSGRTIRAIAPPRGSESIDDLAVADGFLFALDARPPGALSVFSLADPTNPKLVSTPVPVAVGPFSGVSAADRRVVVSGGTSRMSLRSYDTRGRLGTVIATADFGRGQPDVVLARDGKRAFVSTHYWGPYFGVTAVDESLEKMGSIDVASYGFTAGGAKPASFPLQAALDGDTLLVADASGLTTISVANEPRVLAHLDLGVKGVSVAVRDHVAAIVGSSPQPQLVLVDVADARAPRIAKTVPLPQDSYPTGVAIGETRVAVAAHRRGVLFFPR